MSYARFSDESDIYTIAHVLGGWVTWVSNNCGGLPCDGEEYNDSSIAECISRLQWLRSLGYKVPEYAISRLREEMEAANVPE